jgi:acyl-coenzyme A synthetase/AMP-(fatty) acid ligase
VSPSSSRTTRSSSLQISWMAERVAKFKLPKKVFFTDIMPKTATGKIQRRMVAEAMLKQETPKAKL